MFVCLWLITSRLGDIKLGRSHVDPEYSSLSWFAMLFSAGMGIGLMFYGVAEPLMHFSSPPIGESGTIESAKQAMKITFFHWGLHAWAVYAFLAVILAYFCYRKNLPLLPRSTFHPFIGDKIHGRIGDAIDTFAVIEPCLELPLHSPRCDSSECRVKLFIWYRAKWNESGFVDCGHYCDGNYICCSWTDGGIKNNKYQCHSAAVLMAGILLMGEHS